MRENIELHFQIDWFFVVLIAAALCFILNLFIKNKGYRIRFVSSFLLCCVVIAISGIHSYSKLHRIKGSEVLSIEGKVTNFKEYNGSVKFQIHNQEFEINDQDLYCIHGRDNISNNLFIRMDYVDLGRVSGVLMGKCILKITELNQGE